MALYHKHRPQLFSTIIGQEHIVQTLENQVASDNPAHAYLFFGPRGVGKTTTARVLAKALNCQKRTKGKAEPCDVCDSCRDISASRSLDVIEMDAASHTGVDNVRENIIENAQFQPVKSPNKIFIIDEVHMLSTSAFNALLKTLEEPPAHVIFILATTEREKLPETIISRCQRFHFKKIAFDILADHLKRIAKEEGASVDADVLSRMIAKSDGCARDAVSLLDQILAIGEKRITAEIASLILPVSRHEDVMRFAEGLTQRNLGLALQAIRTAADNGTHLPQFAGDTLEMLRLLIILKATGSSKGAERAHGELAEEDVQTLLSWSGTLTSLELVSLIDLLQKRRREIGSSPIPEFPLELLAIEWCQTPIVPSSAVSIAAAAPLPNTVTEKKSEPKAVPANKKEERKEEEMEKAVAYKNLPALDKDEAVRAWNECLRRCEEGSTSLGVILRMARVGEINGRTFHVTVPYTLHREKLTEKAFHHRFEGMLSELLAGAVSVSVRVEAEETLQNDLDGVAALFGGEVVQA